MGLFGDQRTKNRDERTKKKEQRCFLFPDSGFDGLHVFVNTGGKAAVAVDEEGDGGRIDQTEVLNEGAVVHHFVRGTAGHAEEPRKILFRCSTDTLRNVRRNRIGRPSHLVRKMIFLGWKTPDERSYFEAKSSGLLPNP